MEILVTPRDDEPSLWKFWSYKFMDEIDAEMPDAPSLSVDFTDVFTTEEIFVRLIEIISS